MALNFDRVRELFAAFDFAALFIDELHWSLPKGLPPRTITIDTTTFNAKPIAQLAGVVVLEVTASHGDLPDARTRSAIHREIAKAHTITSSSSSIATAPAASGYGTRARTVRSCRALIPVRGQQGDLFLGKVGPLLFEIKDFDADGDISVVNIARRLGQRH